MTWLDECILAFPWSQFTRNRKNVNCVRKNDPNHARWRWLCHSSPDTQAVGALHRLAVPQEEAALVSKPRQQILCGLAPDAAKVEGPNPFQLHSECWATVRGLRQDVPTHVCVQRVRRQKISGLGFNTSFIQVQRRPCTSSHFAGGVRAFSLERIFSPLLCSLPSCPTTTNNKCLSTMIFVFSGYKLTVQNELL